MLTTTLALLAAWSGVYHSPESAGLYEAPKVVIDHCEKASCRFHYTYLGHHVCEVDGKLKPKSETVAEVKVEDCTLTATLSPQTKALTLSRISKACRDFCGVSADIVEGPFQIDNPAKYVASFDCRKASLKVEKWICANLELARLDKEIAEAYAPLKNKLATDQKSWVIARNKSADESALLFTMTKRLQYLKDQSPQKLLPIDYAALKQSVEKLTPDDSANAAAKPLAENLGLKRLIGEDLFDSLNRPSVYCDGLMGRIEKNWVVFSRETCPEGISMILVNEKNEVWAARSTPNAIEVLKPKGAKSELPPPVTTQKENSGNELGIILNDMPS